MRENKDLKEFKEFKELREIWKGKGEGEKAKKNCAGNAGAVVFESILISYFRFFRPLVASALPGCRVRILL